MMQEELLAFIIERGGVTTAEVAKRFGVPVFFAHQVLRRLKDKGVIETEGTPYRFTWKLSEKTQQRLESLNRNPAEYGWIFLLGLALAALMESDSRRKNEPDDSIDSAAARHNGEEES